MTSQDTTHSGGRLAVEALTAEGVTTMFGLLGSATMEMLDALYDAEDIRYVGVRDERTGTHMADGYARASGQAGVMMAGQNGPGVTNLVTGAAQALRAFSPVVTLGGAITRTHEYREGFQDLDQHGLMSAVTKRTYSVPTTDSVYRIMRDGFRTALTPRMGPVHVNLPRDVLAGTASSVQTHEVPTRSRPATMCAATSEQVAAAVQLLRSAERPMIVVGAGIKWGGRHEETLRLAEVLHSPVAASSGHGDAVPTDHRLAVGMVGPRGNPVATELVREADVVLLLGTRLGFNTTFFEASALASDVKVIHVDIDGTVLGREFPCTVGITADAPTVAGQLAAALDGHRAGSTVVEHAERAARARVEHVEQRETDALDAGSATPLMPKRVFSSLRKVLPSDAIITLDAGTACLQATDAFEHVRPPSLFTPLDFGLVGFSLAAGMGAKLARPDRPVVSMIGDGGFGMTVSELSTAVAEDIDTTIIVFDNGVWGAERAYQRDFFGGRFIGSELPHPPFDEVARLYGVHGYRVGAADEVEDVVKTAIGDGGPSVVVIPLDPDGIISFRRDSFKHRQAQH